MLRDRLLRNSRERADASVRGTGLGEYCKCRWVFIFLTSRSFLLGKSGDFGDELNSNELGYSF